ncbi:DUF4258 domain-containing protein [Deltaproteobacteria bacterium TL4]
MATINTIRRKVLNREYEFTIPHFFEEMTNDNLRFSDIERAITTGKIGKKFTRDPRGTRYEVVGTSTDGRRVAVICRIKSTGKLLFITTYLVE